MSRFSGQSPLHLLYGQRGRRVQQVGANCNPCGGGGGGMMPMGGGFARSGMNYGPDLNGVSNFGGSREDRIRYLQGAALAGQIPQIFLGVLANVTPTLAGADYQCEPKTSVPLLVTRFEFEDDIAVFLDVAHFQIGRLDMIVAGRVAGTTFKSDSTAPPIEDPILPAGVSMNISGTNNDSNPHTVRGTLRGIDLTGWLGWINGG